MSRKIFCVFVCLSLSFIMARAAEPLPRRAWFGVGFQPLPDSVRSHYPDSAGIRVMFLPPGSPAAGAGIQKDDIVLTVAGKPVRSGAQLATLVKEQHKAGETVAVETVHDGQRVTRNVTLVEFPREHPGDFDVVYDQFELDGARRRLIITKPFGDGPFPVVAMLGGLGCYTLDNPTGALDAYVQVLYGLTRAGFATVRIEKTGMGDSEGMPCSEQDFDYEVKGLVAGLKSLNRFDYLDSGNLVLYGHSMGGLTAPVTAQQVPVKGIAVQSTSAIGWFEYMMTNSRRQLVLQGVPYDSIEMKQVDAEKAMHALYVEKKPLDEIVKEHPEYAEYLDAPAHYTFMQDVASLNVADYWKKVDAPVLFIYGTSDFVTAAEEHQYGADIVNHYHPGHAEFVQIDDMDHYFLRVPDQKASFANLAAGMPNKQMNREVISVIVDWCRKVTGLTDRRAVER